MVRHGHRRPPQGLIVHDYRLDPDEIAVVRGMRVATPARTGFDLARRLARTDAVVALDALCTATGLKPEAIADVADRPSRGARSLRRVLTGVDAGAQSPPETHTRLALVDAGLPRPETQIPIVGEFAYADMGWRAWRVLVEYDRDHHWLDRRQRAWDIERRARIEKLGWTVVRVGAELLYDRPPVLVARVRGALRDAGFGA